MDSTVIIIFFLSLMDILHSTKQRERLISPMPWWGLLAVLLDKTLQAFRVQEESEQQGGPRSTTETRSNQ